MYGYIAFAFAALSLTTYFLIWPIVEYFRDPKGLRKYPNLNPLSGFTDLAFIYEALLPFRSKRLLEAHQRSPVVRIGPNSLSYASIAAIKDIYGHNTTCIKDVFYTQLSGSHYHLADVVDKQDHQRKRRILSSAYALKNLEGWEYKVADKVERFVKAFDARCTAPLPKDCIRPAAEDLTVNYRDWANFFSLDAIADIGLSERLGFLDQGHDLVTAERMDGTLHKVNYRACLHATASAQARLIWAYEWYPLLTKVSKLIPTFRRWWALNEGWNDIVWHRSMNRLRRYRAGEKLDDFFSALMDDKNGNPNNMEWGEIVAEISIMMNAGSDTTAIAMNNAMFLLLKNPRCLRKLQAEVSSVLSPDEKVAPYDKIRHLPYLRACIDEALRMYPPSTFGLPRRTPPSGAPILGDYIAGDTSVSISAYVAHRDSTTFPSPETYLPERWLGENAKDLQAAFISFSTGARGCIGRNISYLEQSVLLASVVNRFEFALPDPGWEPERRENFNLMPGAMWLKVWRRRREEGVE